MLPEDLLPVNSLPSYDKILKEDGVIEFKTDNRELFEFSLEEVPEAWLEASGAYI